MAKTSIEIGDKLELHHVASALHRALSENVYSSQLLDYDGYRVAKISMPMFEGRIVPLEKDDEYELIFFSAKGMYQCMSRVVDRYTEDRIHIIELEMTSPLRRFQRREYYRLECMIPVAFVYKKPDGSVSERFDGTLVDLSGGGVRLRCHTELDEGTIVQIVIPLNFEKRIQACRSELNVIACNKIDKAREIYEIRGSFENLPEQERENLIQYIFEEQRRRMRKE